jgi:hypothetical protein
MADRDYEILEKGMVGAHEANPEVYSEIVNYLGKYGKIPEFAREYLGGASGAFEYDPWDLNGKTRGRILFDRRYGAIPQSSTVIHELTHAADRQLGFHYAALKEQGIQNQFTDAYEQFRTVPRRSLLDSSERKGMGVEEAIKKLSPNSWREDNKEYRTDPKEAIAYGVGNSATKTRDSYDTPLHLDPTLSTNFRILMDLANRFPIPKPKETKKKAGGKISLPEEYNKGGKVSLI